MVHNGQFYADIPSAMALLGSIQNDLVGIVKNVEVTLSSVNKVLTDEEMKKELKMSISNLAELSAKLNKITDENRESIRTMTLNGAELTKETRSFIADNKSNVKNTVEDMRSALKNTNDLLVKINDFAEETKNQKNNAGKLLYDEKLISELKESMQQVGELTKTINDQMNQKGLKVDAKIHIF